MTRIVEVIPVLNIPIHVIIHPNYSSFFNRDDIAIVQLSRPAVLGDYVDVARLPRRYHAAFSFTGWNSTVAGWGSSGNRDNEPLPLQHLHFAHGEVITNFVCGLSHSFVREGHICTTTEEGGPCDVSIVDQCVRNYVFTNSIKWVFRVMKVVQYMQRSMERHF